MYIYLFYMNVRIIYIGIDQKDTCLQTKALENRNKNDRIIRKSGEMNYSLEGSLLHSTWKIKREYNQRLQYTTHICI